MNESPLEILCADGPLLAVNKPAGMLTQGVPAGLPTLEAAVREYLRRQYDKPGNVYLGIPHRLDRPVSGVIVFARNSKAAARLAEQFRERRVRKWYLAVVAGRPEPPQEELRDWLLKDPAAATSAVVPAGTAGAKEAVLQYEVLQTVAAQSLVRIELLTGRMHQIRVQFATRGWPIVGDVQYGSAASAGRATVEPRTDVIALHAAQLELFHPIRYDRLTLRAPLPAAWREFPFDWPDPC